jgi:hypothetical protein
MKNFGTVLLVGVGAFIAYKMIQKKNEPKATATKGETTLEEAEMEEEGVEGQDNLMIALGQAHGGAYEGLPRPAKGTSYSTSYSSVNGWDSTPLSYGM